MPLFTTLLNCPGLAFFDGYVTIHLPLKDNQGILFRIGENAMNRVNIYRSASKSQTSVPNLFIDEYMADANDAQLKIYLYLIRMMNDNLPTSISDIADKFNYTEKDVERALAYWEARQLLSLKYDGARNLSGIEVLPLENADRSSRTTPVLSFVKPAESKAEPAVKHIESNEDIEQITAIAEQYVGRPLTKSDADKLLFIYDELGFSVELIDYLVQHCIELGKKDFRYMQKVAINWHEQGITSPKEAQDVSRRYDKVVYTIMKSLGKNANPATKELDYIEKWTKDYGFLLDVIQEACDKTTMSTDSHRFEYADSILSRWYNAGIRTKADIESADTAYKNSRQSQSQQSKATKNKFNAFSQNNYDFDQLEKNIISN